MQAEWGVLHAWTRCQHHVGFQVGVSALARSPADLSYIQVDLSNHLSSSELIGLELLVQTKVGEDLTYLVDLRQALATGFCQLEQCRRQVVVFKHTQDLICILTLGNPSQSVVHRLTATSSLSVVDDGLKAGVLTLGTFDSGGFFCLFSCCKA